MKDQAEELRKIVGSISSAKIADKKIRSIMLLSQKDGNENSNISVSLSQALNSLGKKTLIFGNYPDSDLNKKISDLSNTAKNYDYLIIDSGMEITENTIQLANFAGTIIFTAQPNQASITDAYSMSKTLVSGMKKNIYFLINNTADDFEEKINTMAKKIDEGEIGANQSLFENFAQSTGGKL